jgi:hypothetical protein
MGEPLEAPVGMDDGNTAMLAVADASSGCPDCGWAPVDGASFCSHCGARLAGDSDDDGRTSYSVERRLYGVPPPELLCALGAIGLVVAIVLFAGGRWVAAGVVLLPALTLACMFVSTAKRFPESRTAGAAVASRRWLRGRLAVAGVSLAAWSHGVREIVGLAWTRRKLRADLDAQIGRLGEAVYADDPDLANYLKAEAHANSEQLDELERRRDAVAAEARQQIDQAKETIRPTEIVHQG